ncbi:MAG: hypothetical protein ACKO43_04920 [Alphaproteobacteria bacterium]
MVCQTHCPASFETNYGPKEYDQIDLVGFRLENGEYLPTKVFVRGNFGVGEKQLERMLMKRFVVGLFLGGVIAMVVMVVGMVG